MKASGKRLRVQPRKARLVAKEIRGKHAVLAMAELRYHPSKGAAMLRKVIGSAVANAVENEKREAGSLVIARVDIDEGMRMKRIKARAQGRANRILKRTSHITVVLEDGEPLMLRKSNAKPKPRPKFDAAPKKKSAKKEEAAPEEVMAEAAAVEAEASPAEESAEVEASAEAEPQREEPQAEEEQKEQE
jgi:large subunit ribosomal protein L22